MTLPRYVKSPEQLAWAAENNAEFLPSTAKQLAVDYRTDFETVAAIVPRPLSVDKRAIVHVAISQVEMHLPSGIDMTIGSGIVGILCDYEGSPGYYLVTMPMTTEAAVVGGRETYGEPKKIAEIDFQTDGNHVHAAVRRHGVNYIEFDGEVGAERPAQNIQDHAFCYKILPSCSGEGFDFDPLLIRLNWLRKQEKAFDLSGELKLNESPLDPVVDLPIREVVGMHYELVNTESNGEVLRSVPADWLYPFVHQRYDDFAAAMAG